ncbi:MAG: hypothetical protein WKG07_14695 [Hymenobacter sp.]
MPGSAFFKKFLAHGRKLHPAAHAPQKLLLDAYTKAREKKEIGASPTKPGTTLQSLFRLIKLSASGEYAGRCRTSSAVAGGEPCSSTSSRPIDLDPRLHPGVGPIDDMALVAVVLDYHQARVGQVSRVGRHQGRHGRDRVDDELWQTRSAGTTGQSATNAAPPYACPSPASRPPMRAWARPAALPRPASTTEARCGPGQPPRPATWPPTLPTAAATAATAPRSNGRQRALGRPSSAPG